MTKILSRWLFRAAWQLNRTSIQRQCWVSPSYYAYTCMLITELFDGQARETWLCRVDAGMRVYAMGQRAH